MFLVLTSSSSAQQAESTPTPTPLLQTLPLSVLNAELKSARGGPFKLSDYSGNVLVINLWATWLGPSMYEIPALVKLQKKYWSRGVRVIGLTNEAPDISAREVRNRIRDYRINYKVGWAPENVAGILMVQKPYAVLPQTLVISPSGRILRRFLGFNPGKTPSLVEIAVREALQEKSDHPEKQ